jgi:hypothetical protein
MSSLGAKPCFEKITILMLLELNNNIIDVETYIFLTNEGV